MQLRSFIFALLISCYCMQFALADDITTIRAKSLVVEGPDRLDPRARGLEIISFTKNLIFLSPFDGNSDNLDRISVAFKLDPMNGTAKLNPKMKGKFIEVEYINIPTNAELTTHDCDRLWGNNISNSPSYKTYKLLRVVSKKELESGVSREYFIDAIFENGKLSKYKIRGPEIKSIDWQSA